MNDFEVLTVVLGFLTLLVSVAIAAYKAGKSNEK